MISKKPLSLPASPAREVSLHLWPAGEERRSFDWKSAQSLLMRRRKPLLITFGLVLGHLLLALWMLAPLYRATAKLQVQTEAVSSGGGDVPIADVITGAGQARTLTTQIEILSDDSVRDRAMKMLSPAQRAAVNTKSAVVKAIPDTNLLNITTSSRNAAAAAAYSNALATTYLQLSRDQNGAQYTLARQVVGKQLNETRARLNRVRSDIAKFKQAQKTTDLPAETAGLIAERDRVETERSTARADKISRQAQINALRATLPGLPQNVVASSVIAKSPEVVAKQAALTKLETDLITAQGEFSASAPEVRQLVDQITALRRDLQSAAQTEVTSQGTAINPQRVLAEQQIAQFTGEYLALEARGVALKARAKEVAAQLDKLPAREQRLSALNTEITGLQQAYDTLNQKYQSLRASEAARVSSGALLFAATPPGGADSRLTPFNLALCLGAASLLALGVASLIDRIDSRVHSPRDLTSNAELPVLAQIPAILNGSSQSLLALQSPVSPLLENYRGLRTMLALSGAEDGQSVRTLVVTSSLPKEGKSLTALNLAVAAARGGERVVLVDCDLRRPSQHRLCNLSNDVGFINVANGDANLEDALQSTQVPGLRVLTSGPIASNPFHALNSFSGREIFRRLSEIADLVIIDTPPVLVLADARITATLADAVLLVVSTEEPDREEVALATDLLRQSGANVAGIVLNKVAPGPEFRDYYSRYPYYTVAVDGVGPDGHQSSGSGSSHVGSNGTNGHSNGNSSSVLSIRAREASRQANREASRETNREASRETKRETRAPRPSDDDDDEGTTMVSYRPSGRSSDD